jgi:hypothetical protein
VPGLFVKAFTLSDMSQRDRDRLFEGISEAGQILYSQSGVRGEHDSVQLNKATDILIVTGSESYVDLVNRIVDAFRQGLKAKAMSVAPEPDKRRLIAD